MPLHVGIGYIGPRSDDDARAVEQVGLVAAELVEEHPLLLLGSAALGGGQVDQHHERSSALDVAQEPVAEAATLARSFDQPGDVGDDHLERVVESHDAEVRFEGRERVVGDLGLRGGDAADQRALSRVRKADERDVGHEPQLEQQPLLLAPLSLLRERRSPSRVREEAGVPPATSSAGGGTPPIAVVHEVGQKRPRLHRSHRRALRHRDDDVLPRRSVLALPRAVGAIRRAAVRMVAEREQRGDVVVCDEPDVAARSPITAVGPATGHVGLTAERDTASAAVAAAHVERALVDEPGHRVSVGVGSLSGGAAFSSSARQRRLRYSTSRTGSPLSVAVHVVVSFGCAPPL